MPIPDHELVPKSKPGPKPGSKSSPHQMLKRIVQIGQMLHVQGMTFTEIYEWNMDPARALDPETQEPIPGGNQWAYGRRQLWEMMQRAEKMGASLLCKDYETALRQTLRQLHDLKRKAIAGGDFRVAFLCVAQIAKIQETWVGKSSKIKRINGDKSTFHWAAPKQIDAAPSTIDLESIAGLS